MRERERECARAHVFICFCKCVLLREVEGEEWDRWGGREGLL